MRGVRSVLALALLPALLCVTPGCGGRDERQSPDPALASDDLYTLVLTKERKEKDLHFLRDADSPLTDEQKTTFHSLRYFPIDTTLVFTTALQPFSVPEEVVMATSKDRPRPMLCIGELPFERDGVPHALRVYVSKDPARGRSWFIPFTDAGTGAQSYPGGRYLDIEPPEDGAPVVLDFNRAYNPYCAYNPRYDCPIPPAENRLSFAVTAGEALFGDGK